MENPMGASLTNFHVRGRSMEDVEQAARRLIASRAVVLQNQGPWVTLIDEASESQEIAVVVRLARGLSASLDAPVLALLIHQSDVCCYYLYDHGTQVDQYFSNPDYTDATTSAARRRYRGSPDTLARYAAVPVSRRQIEQMLWTPDNCPGDEDVVDAYDGDDEDDRAADLLKVLGIPRANMVWMFQEFLPGGALELAKRIGHPSQPRRHRLVTAHGKAQGSD
jgi:hypothetical protein